MASIKAFCGGRSFWGSRAEDRALDPAWTTDVDLSTCFEDVVLTAVPTLLLALGIVLRVLWLRKRPFVKRHSSSLFVAKQALQWAVALEFVFELADGIWVRQQDYLIFASAIMLLGAVLAINLLEYEHAKGTLSSGTLWLFWFVSVIVAGIRTRTYVLRYHHGDRSTLRLGLMLGYVIATFLSFVLTCFKEPLDYVLRHQDANPCPENFATLPSLISFWWMNPIMVLGHKRPLVDEDLWNLNPEDQAHNLSKRFDDAWTQEQAKRPKKPRLVPALRSAFGSTFFVAGLFKFGQDVLAFTSPQLLKQLIRFITQSSSDAGTPVWRGYFLAVCMFLVALIQSILLHQYFHRVMKTGMRLRSALVSAVYAKSLRLSSTARQSVTTGEIVNYMAVDAQRFQDITTYLHMLWSAPLQITLSIFFLWQLMGPATLAGVGVMILTIPLNGYIAKKSRVYQVQQMKQKDQRIKQTNEVLNGIKVIKLYAWERPFHDLIALIRSKEMHVLKLFAYLNAVGSFTWTFAPFAVSLLTFATYTLTGGDLTAEKAFVSLSLFNLLRFPLAMLPMLIAFLVQTHVSLGRLRGFLTLEEMDFDAIDKYDFNEEFKPSTPAASSTSKKNGHNGSASNGHSKAAQPILAIVDGNFSWKQGSDDCLHDITLVVDRPSLIGIVGPVGCGKTSLVMALLGEMYKCSGTVRAPRSVAFVPQQAWVRNMTLRDNILFGKAYDPIRYQQVIEACALSSDIDILPGGDMTEIGEKGINLSGGQKQRVSLARAVYQDASVYILDDPLSAVDAHVGKHIFKRVVGPNGMLKNKSRLLVTHLIHFLPQTDKVVSMKEGRIVESGPYEDLIKAGKEFSAFIEDHQTQPGKKDDGDDGEQTQEEARNAKTKALAKATSTDSTDSSAKVGSGKELTEKTSLIEKETAQEGGIKFAVYQSYFKAVGYLLSSSILGLYILAYSFQIGTNFWLSYWSNQTEKHLLDPNYKPPLEKYLGVYAALGLGNAVCVLISSIITALGAINASVVLHSSMLKRVLRAPMAFFDTTPLGRIVNRFSKDVFTIDETIPRSVRSFLQTFMQVVSIIVVISVATPYFMLAVLPMFFVYYFIQRFYVATSRQLKRLESVRRSPVYSHFSETLNGVSSIRAYGKTEEFITESEGRVNQNVEAYYPSVCANRWLAIRLEFVGNCIIFFAALFAVIDRRKLQPGIVGLSLSYAMNVTQTLNWMVRMSSQLETDIVAIERVEEYTKLDTEAPAIASHRPSVHWPEHGAVTISGLSVRYREGLDLVLRGIDCEIRPGEKIGIVGRTGAGKSSLTVALFRIIEAASGKIIIDGEDISKIGLEDLRKRITIMPQDPVLFCGTVRDNLDPFHYYDDSQIWQALETCHLKAHVQSIDDGLEGTVAEGGENFSVGQRQLMCLARAVLRKTKVLVLDEATAAVDLDTDQLIQQTIRTEFRECTILTIAHRLNTIMDSDRILVLGQGRIVEFDAPEALLADPESDFHSMAAASGLL